MKFAYKVFALRESLVGGKQSGSQLETTLNHGDEQGWRCAHIVKADVPGRVMGHTERLLVIMERSYE
jgi:Domain of unknown function (DUF4177)